MDSELCFAPATDLRTKLDNKEISIVELTQLFIDRIQRLNPKLNAYLTICEEQALAAAKEGQLEMEKGEHRGPLHGIPISIKDLEMTQGITTTMGSLIYKDSIASFDSVVVERVKKSGAIILGKTNTPEFGQSGTTENLLGGPCRNPWNIERTPGGSSGGAASALAAGLCAVATGSDGGGSIRIPASFTGLFGIKPSQGRIARYGGYGRPAANHFSQSGPLSRTVMDSANLLQVLSGPDPRDPTSIREIPPDFTSTIKQGIRDLRIGWSPDLGYAGVDPEVVTITEEAAKAFASLGARVEEINLLIEDPFEAFYNVFSTATYTSYGHLLGERRNDFTDYVRNTLDHASNLSASDLSVALLRVDQIRRQMENFFDNYDLLLTPTMAVTAFPIEERPTVIGGKEVNPFWGYLPFTFPINMTGQTAASVPCGFSHDGMPVGLHIIGPKGSEPLILRASSAFETGRPWIQHRPPEI